MTSQKALYVMDPLERVDPNADTSFAFMLEAQARGIQNLVCSIHELSSRGRTGFCTARPVEVRRPTEDDASHFSFGAPAQLSFDDIEVIWMRKDPPVDEVFHLATMILDRHDPQKTLVLNTPSSLRVANEKLWGLYAAELGPETVVSFNPKVLTQTVREWGRGVLKPLTGAGGSGVMAFKADDKNLNAAADLLTKEGTRPALAQAFVPDVTTGDKRVILLGGEPIGAVLRVPQGNDNRSNMHVGGTVEQVDVDEHDRRIAAHLKPALVELGLHFVGIDVIGGKLTEVNVTSPTGVQEIDRLDGRTGKETLSSQVWDYVERLLP